MKKINLLFYVVCLVPTFSLSSDYFTQKWKKYTSGIKAATLQVAIHHYHEHDIERFFIKLCKKNTTVAQVTLSQKDSEQDAFLTIIEVDPAYQRHKLGSFLFECALDWARARGCKKLCWEYGYLDKQTSGSDMLKAFDKAHAFYMHKGAEFSFYQRDTEQPILCRCSYYKNI